MRVLELAGERVQLGERPFVIVAGPRPAQPLLHGRPVALGEVVEHVALLVADTALHRYGAEHLVDRLPQRLGAVDHAQHALAEVKAAGDEVREQRLGDGRVLGRAVPQPERQLDAVGRDPERDHAAAALQLDPVQHQHRQPDVVEAATHQAEQVLARARDKLARDGRARRRPRLRLDLDADRLACALETTSGNAGEQLLEHVPSERVAVGEVLVGAQRDLAAPVDAADPWPLDPDAATAKRHLARLVPVADRAPLRVVLALRADDVDDFLLHQLSEHTKPDADAQGEQPLLGRIYQLTERLLHARRQPELTRADLLSRYGLHGGSSCLDDDFALATVAARPDEAGGPPPQVLRATRQPPATVWVRLRFSSSANRSASGQEIFNAWHICRAIGASGYPAGVRPASQRRCDTVSGSSGSTKRATSAITRNRPIGSSS